MPKALPPMKSLEFPWQKWRHSDIFKSSEEMVTFFKEGLPKGFGLRHVSINARTGNITVFYEEGHAERQPSTRTP